MAVCDTAGRKAAGGGDESAARVDASCEQPVKPGRFLTSHQPGAIRAGNEAGKCGRIPGKRVLWRQGMDMKKRILTYLQFSLQGTGVAALGTLNIYEPKAAHYRHRQQGGVSMSIMTAATIFVVVLTIGGVVYALYGK